jgi:hypothetical protein
MFLLEVDLMTGQESYWEFLEHFKLLLNFLNFNGFVGYKFLEIIKFDKTTYF